MSLYHVLMGDIVGSSQRRAPALAARLREVTADAQSVFAADILSPLTVTLGDEFQTVVASHQATVGLVLHFLHKRLTGELPFPLRFSLATGAIDTPINPEIAHEMLGPALTTARRSLVAKGKDRPLVAVSLPDADLTQAMQSAFDILYRRTESWAGEEGAYLAELVDTDKPADEIADRHDRTKPTVYRRRRSEAVRDYIEAREVLIRLAALADRLEPTWS